MDGQDLDARLLPPDERVGEILLGVRGALLDEHDTPDAVRQQPAGRWKVRREADGTVVENAGRRLDRVAVPSAIVEQKRGRRRWRQREPRKLLGPADQRRHDRLHIDDRQARNLVGFRRGARIVEGDRAIAELGQVQSDGHTRCARQIHDHGGFTIGSVRPVEADLRRRREDGRRAEVGKQHRLCPCRPAGARGRPHLKDLTARHGRFSSCVRSMSTVASMAE